MGWRYDSQDMFWNQQCWWTVNLLWCPHMIKSGVRIDLCIPVAVNLYIFKKKKKNSGSELGVLKNTFSLLIFPCACVCFCVHVRVYGALELRNEFDLPSASLMHANLLLASQENNFSHSTNKVQTPATQSSRVLTGRDSSNETHARKSPAERGSKLQISCWKLIV